MRLGASSPQISIGDDEAVNWLWYCSPAYRDEDFEPSARARPASEPLAAAQWRTWHEQLWGRGRRDPSRFRLADVTSWGDDPPRFASLSRWPELQAHCQAGWPSFPGWYDAARVRTIALNSTGHVHRSIRQAIAVMSPGQRVRLHIVALAVPRVLIQERDRAVIAAGLLRAEDRFDRWLIQFVAADSS